MSQSLYTAMSGISSATTDLEVISNNVANINTTAFKSSSVNFSDVYSETISYGSVAAGTTGGKNPVQVGVGTQVSSISKNFNTGSATATGKSTDFMIQGAGFFTVESADLKTYYTRAGDFSWDNMGNLVTSDGYKVLGAGSILSTTSSASTVRVPTSIISVVTGNATIGTQTVASLNNTNGAITAGNFTINITDNGSPAVTTPKTVSLAATDLDGDVNKMIAAINTDLAGSGVSASCANGSIMFSVNGTTATKVSFGAIGDTSNFVNKTDLANSSPVPIVTTNGTPVGGWATTPVIGVPVGGPPWTTAPVAGVPTNGWTTPPSATNPAGVPVGGWTTAPTVGAYYQSATLDYTAAITDVTAAAAATSINSTTINADGSIQATYANGDTLSVKLGADKATYEFVYTTSKGTAISGSSLTVSNTVAVPANFVMQVATITNTDGLISQGSNLFSAGPNSGNIVYTVGNQMGAGAIKSGYLEASNVDLSEELSKMILAQRAVQANSRVFTTVSDTMNTIVQMGR